ncbi:MAG: hypothetical protein PVJ82_07125 [Desulfobacteraceae bacterium]
MAKSMHNQDLNAVILKPKTSSQQPAAINQSQKKVLLIEPFSANI